jgi:transcriptional regulator with GAF, ATPase, and Fis domain
MRTPEPPLPAIHAVDINIHKGTSAPSILKLRHLISSLINEVDTLDRSFVPITEAFFTAECDGICFYEEVERFEIALIKAALQRTNGHQVRAARLLNLNPTTLNAKIRQYELKHLVV